MQRILLLFIGILLFNISLLAQSSFGIKVAYGIGVLQDDVNTPTWEEYSKSEKSDLSFVWEFSKKQYGLFFRGSTELSQLKYTTNMLLLYGVNTPVDKSEYTTLKQLRVAIPLGIGYDFRIADGLALSLFAGGSVGLVLNEELKLSGDVISNYGISDGDPKTELTAISEIGVRLDTKSGRYIRVGGRYEARKNDYAQIDFSDIDKTNLIGAFVAFQF